MVDHQLRILYVLEADSKHGAAKSAKQLITEIVNKTNTQVIVVVPVIFKDYKYYRSIGCRVIRLPYTYCLQSKPYNFLKYIVKYILCGMVYYFGNKISLLLLCNYLKQTDIDIIHCNSSRLDLGAEVSRKTKIPLVWHLREFGDKDFRRFGYRTNYIQYMNDSAKLFIAISEAVSRHWMKKGIKREMIVTVYNGVDANVGYKRSYALKHNECHFVFAGTLMEAKCQDQVVDALCKIGRNDIFVDFIGDGSPSYIRYLKEKVECAGLLSNIRFCGYIENANRDFEKYDAAIMCSKSEGFGRVTAEYMMAGLPVIASDTGANKELISDSENGLLYEWKDIESLKNKIEIITDSSAIREKLGKSARSKALKDYSSKGNYFEISQQYDRIINYKDQINESS